MEIFVKKCIDEFYDLIVNNPNEAKTYVNKWIEHRLVCENNNLRSVYYQFKDALDNARNLNNETYRETITKFLKSYKLPFEINIRTYRVAYISSLTGEIRAKDIKLINDELANPTTFASMIEYEKQEDILSWNLIV